MCLCSRCPCEVASASAAGLCAHPPGGQPRLAYTTWQSWQQSACCSETRFKWQSPRWAGQQWAGTTACRVQALEQCLPLLLMSLIDQACVPAAAATLLRSKVYRAGRCNPTAAPVSGNSHHQPQLSPVTKGSAAERMSIHMHHTCGERKAPRKEWR